MLLVQGASAIFAFLAAILWFLSARVPTPSNFIVTTFGHTDAFGTHVSGQGSSPQLTELGNALLRQSRLSAYAAFCAGVSALFQVVALYLSVTSGTGS